jgi:ribosomal-protein-alanine N-acetyltransferase
LVVASLELMRGVDDAEILNIETNASHRRQGLAQSLLAEAFTWARQNQRQAVWLEVRAGNNAAINLYRKTGFVQLSTRARYYADGEDALVMKYTL